MRTDIDNAKLERLRADLIEKRAAIEGLSDRYRRDREHGLQCVAEFRVCRAAAVHYRNGDDPAIFLSLTPAEQTYFSRETAGAREIQQQRDRARELHARIETLRPSVDALARLVAACERYVMEA
jgi:predicted  nucleic acid-binding Zn-ribbon protein